MEVSKTLKKMMIDKEIKQIEIADALGILKQSFSRQLKNDDLKLSDIVKIADVLGYDVHVQFVDRETGDVTIEK